MIKEHTHCTFFVLHWFSLNFKGKPLTKPKTTNSGWRKTRTSNKAEVLKDSERLYIDANRLTNAEYHSIENAVSSSALKELFYGKNPQYCYKKYILKEVEHKQTDAMLVGAATHKLILEPKTFKHEFAVWEGGRRAGGEWQAFKLYHSGKDIITKAQFDEIEKMRVAVMANPEAKNLLTGGIPERSVFWRDEETGLLCRARADYIKESGGKTILIDLKTCVSAEPEKFTRDLFNMGYPLQECMYRTGFNASAFAFIAVEKGTNTVQVYTLDELFDDVGYFVYRQALEKWADCLKNNDWSTYRVGVSELKCPEYLANKVLAYE